MMILYVRYETCDAHSASDEDERFAEVKRMCVNVGSFEQNRDLGLFLGSGRERFREMRSEGFSKAFWGTIRSAI